MKAYMDRLNNVKILPSVGLEGTTHFADLLVEEERVHVPYAQKDQVEKIYLDKTRIGRYLDILALEEPPATISLDQSRIRGYIQELASTTQGPQREQLLYRPRIKLMKEAVGSGNGLLRLQREVRGSRSEDETSQHGGNIHGKLGPHKKQDGYQIYEDNLEDFIKFDKRLRGEVGSYDENYKIDSIVEGNVQNIDEYNNLNDLSLQEPTEVDANSITTATNKSNTFGQELSRSSMQVNSYKNNYNTDHEDINTDPIKNVNLQDGILGNHNTNDFTTNLSKNIEIQEVPTNKRNSSISEIPLDNSNNIINDPISHKYHSQINTESNIKTNTSANIGKIEPNLIFTQPNNLSNISGSDSKNQGNINSVTFNNEPVNISNTLKATHENKSENTDTNIITTFPIVSPQLNTSLISNEKYINKNSKNDKGLTKNEFRSQEQVSTQNNGSDRSPITKYDEPALNPIPVRSINSTNMTSINLNSSSLPKSTFGVENKNVQIETTTNKREPLRSLHGPSSNNSQKFLSNETQTTHNITLNDEEKRLLQDIIPNFNITSSSTTVSNDQLTNSYKFTNTQKNINSQISKKPDQFKTKGNDGDEIKDLYMAEKLLPNSELQKTIGGNIGISLSKPNINSLPLPSIFNNVIDKMGINMKKILEDPSKDMYSVSIHIFGPNMSQNHLSGPTSTTSLPTENILSNVKSELPYSKEQEIITTENSKQILDAKHESDIEDHVGEIPVILTDKKEVLKSIKTNFESNGKNMGNINTLNTKLQLTNQNKVETVKHALEQPNSLSTINNPNSLENKYENNVVILQENEKKNHELNLINKSEDACSIIEKSHILHSYLSPNNFEFLEPTKPPEMFDSYYDTVRKEILKHSKPETSHVDGTNKHELYNIINQNLNNVIEDKSSLYKIIGRAIETVENGNYPNKNFMPQWLEDRYKETELSSHKGGTYREVVKEPEDEVNSGPVYPAAMMHSIRPGDRGSLEQPQESKSDRRPYVEEAVHPLNHEVHAQGKT